MKEIKFSAELEKRIIELEEIVREQNHTMQDMYDTGMESAWSKKSSELQMEYEEKYSVSLEYNEGSSSHKEKEQT